MAESSGGLRLRKRWIYFSLMLFCLPIVSLTSLPLANSAIGLVSALQSGGTFNNGLECDGSDYAPVVSFNQRSGAFDVDQAALAANVARINRTALHALDEKLAYNRPLSVSDLKGAILIAGSEPPSLNSSASSGPTSQPKPDRNRALFEFMFLPFSFGKS